MFSSIPFLFHFEQEQRNTIAKLTYFILSANIAANSSRHMDYKWPPKINKSGSSKAK